MAHLETAMLLHREMGMQPHCSWLFAFYIIYFFTVLAAGMSLCLEIRLTLYHPLSQHNLGKFQTQID